MYQVTLLFPSWVAFHLWCQAMSIARDGEEPDTLHLNGRFLGHYWPSPDTLDGIMATVNVQAPGGVQ